MKLTRYRDWWRVVGAAMKDEPWWRVALGMARALATGGVSRAEWRRRLKVCGKCPIYRPVGRTCGPRDGAVVGIDGVAGCGCYVPFAARTDAPYQGEGGRGCWGRAVLGIRFGWGSERRSG